MERHQRVRALLDSKLGACPKCMSGSIAGSALSWFILGICYAAWPNRAVLTLGLAVAAAFTLLMITHAVVHMIRVRLALRRYLAERGDRQPALEPVMKSRREFAVVVARSGFAFASAAVLLLVAPAPVHGAYSCPQKADGSCEFPSAGCRGKNTEYCWTECRTVAGKGSNLYNCKCVTVCGR